MTSIDEILTAQGTTHPCVPLQLLLSLGFFIFGLGSLETSTLLPVPLYGCWNVIPSQNLRGGHMCKNLLSLGKSARNDTHLSPCSSYLHGNWWEGYAWAGILLLAGRMLICIAAGIGLDVFGRKRCAIVWFGSYFVFAFARSFIPLAAAIDIAVTMEAICSQAAIISMLLIAIEGSTQKECVRSACLVMLGHGLGVVLGIPLFSSYIPQNTYLQLARSLPSVAFVLYIFFLPESIRWIITQGKLEHIEYTIASSHRVKLEEDLKPKLASIYPRMRKELSEYKSRGNPLKQSVVPVLLAKPLLRVVTPLVLISFLTGSAISFRLLNDPLPYPSLEDRIVAAGIAELIALQLLGLLLARIPVKRVLFFISIGFGVAIALTRLLVTVGIASCIGNVILSTGGHFFCVIIWTWITISVCRLTPTHSRGMMLGLTVSFGTFGHFSAVPIYEVLKNAFQDAGVDGSYDEYFPAIVFSGFLLLASLISLILPNTPGTLPDMMSHVAPHLFWHNEETLTYIPNHEEDENTRL